MDIIARIKRGKNFEILVDCEKAIAFKKGQKTDFLSADAVFLDTKKGIRANSSELMKAFGTADVKKIAEIIVREGELVLPAEYKEKERENKRKQIIDFLSKNTVDPRTGMPHTPARIEEALRQAGIKIEERSIEEQIPKIIDKLSIVLPIKIEKKQLEIVVPAAYSGKAYSLLRPFLSKEEWQADGSLFCIVSIPAGMQLEFYDKLNSITHGEASVKEKRD